MNSLHSIFLEEMRKHEGREAAIPRSDLARILGISAREASEIKAELVEIGFLIGSTSGKCAGYFMVTDPEDRRIAARHLRSKVVAMSRQLKTFEKSKAVLELLGQLSNLEEMDEGLKPLD